MRILTGLALLAIGLGIYLATGQYGWCLGLGILGFWLIDSTRPQTPRRTPDLVVDVHVRRHRWWL